MTAEYACRQRRGMQRLTCQVAVAIVAAFGGRWLYSVPVTEVAPRVATHPLQVNRPYPIPVAAAGRGFVLPIQPSSRFLLVCGSLGDPERTYDIRLTSQPADRLAPIPLQESTKSGLPRNYEFARPVVATGGTTRRTNAVDRRTFHLHVTDGDLDDPRHYTAIDGRLLAAGRYVAVYRDSTVDASKRLRQTAADVINILEDDILPRCRRIVGRHRDVDGDERLTVLLTPWLGRLQGGKTALGGLVRSADFRPDGKPPFSNRCDMLFLNSSVSSGPHLKTLLAHEYTHALAFSVARSATNDGLTTVEDDWLNEGIAHVFERLHGEGWSNLDYRIHAYLASPQRFPLVVPNYYTAGLWRTHGCRGATFLFLQWCADRYGPAMLRALLRSGRTGVDNLEHATGRRFEDLFRDWAVAVVAQDTQSPTPAMPLRIKCGEYQLNGPRPVEWCIGEEKTVQLRGTSVVYINLRPSRVEASLRRLTISAAADARLQITLIKLPDERATNSR